MNCFARCSKGINDQKAPSHTTETVRDPVLNIAQVTGEGIIRVVGTDSEVAASAFDLADCGKINRMVTAVDPQKQEIKGPGNEDRAGLLAEDDHQLGEAVRRLKMEVDCLVKVPGAFVAAAGEENDGRWPHRRRI